LVVLLAVSAPSCRLGNDFVALVKDSSLVSVLGVADITRSARSTPRLFRFFETYNVVAFFYLLMTVGLIARARALERACAPPLTAHLGRFLSALRSRHRVHEG
jgi:ABC-type amino acid transport system permease subunit